MTRKQVGSVVWGREKGARRVIRLRYPCYHGQQPGDTIITPQQHPLCQHHTSPPHPAISHQHPVWQVERRRSNITFLTPLDIRTIKRHNLCSKYPVITLSGLLSRSNLGNRFNQIANYHFITRCWIITSKYPIFIIPFIIYIISNYWTTNWDSKQL